MLVRLNHTASLTLPSVPGKPLGVTLEPGDNDVDAEYMAAVAGNPTVKAWTDGGLLKVGASTPEEPPKAKAKK